MMNRDEGRLWEQVTRETHRLKDEFGGIFNAETIKRYIHESWDSLLASQPSVTSYLPLLVRRFARATHGPRAMGR